MTSDFERGPLAVNNVIIDWNINNKTIMASQHKHTSKLYFQCDQGYKMKDLNVCKCLKT